MPSYEVTTPSGKKYRVDVPEGATQADAIAYVAYTYPDAGRVARAPKTAAPTAAPQQNTLGRVMTNLVETARPYVSAVNPLVGAAMLKPETLIDPAAEAAANALGTTRTVLDAFGANEDTTQYFQGATQRAREARSVPAQERSMRAARTMQDAEGQGFLKEAGSAVKAFTQAPGEMLAGAVGSIAPIVAIPLAASFAGAPTAVAGGIGTGLGALSGFGTVKGSIYDAVRQELSASGVDPRAAELAAREAQAYGGENLSSILTGGALGAIAGRTGVEKTILRGVFERVLGRAAAQAAGESAERSVVGAVARGAASEGATEGLQGGQERYAVNRALQNVGYAVPTWEGVVGQGVSEGIVGALLGGAAGPLDVNQSPPATNAPGAPPASPAPGTQTDPDASLSSFEQAVAEIQARRNIPREDAEAMVRMAMPELEQVEDVAGTDTGGLGAGVPSPDGEPAGGRPAGEPADAGRGDVGAAGGVDGAPDQRAKLVEPPLKNPLPVHYRAVVEAFKSTALDYEEDYGLKFAPVDIRASAAIIANDPTVTPEDAVRTVIEKRVEAKAMELPETSNIRWADVSPDKVPETSNIRWADVSPDKVPETIKGPDYIVENARGTVDALRQNRPDVLKQVTDLHADDFTAGEIAQQTGLPPEIVRDVRLGLGLPGQGKPYGGLATGPGDVQERAAFEAWRDNYKTAGPLTANAIVWKDVPDAAGGADGAPIQRAEPVESPLTPDQELQETPVTEVTPPLEPAAAPKADLPPAVDPKAASRILERAKYQGAELVSPRFRPAFLRAVKEGLGQAKPLLIGGNRNIPGWVEARQYGFDFAKDELEREAQDSAAVPVTSEERLAATTKSIVEADSKRGGKPLAIIGEPKVVQVDDKDVVAVELNDGTSVELSYDEDLLDNDVGGWFADDPLGTSEGSGYLGDSVEEALGKLLASVERDRSRTLKLAAKTDKTVKPTPTPEPTPVAPTEAVAPAPAPEPTIKEIPDTPYAPAWRALQEFEAAGAPTEAVEQLKGQIVGYDKLKSEGKTPAMTPDMLARFITRRAGQLTTGGETGARYMEGDAPTGPVMAKEEVQAEIDRVVKGVGGLRKWTGAPEIVVVDTFDQLPEAYKKAARGEQAADGEQDVGRGIRGLTSRSGKKVYIVADQHTDAKQVRITLFHEALGHAGLTKAFRKELEGLLVDIYAGSVPIREAAAAWEKKNPGAYPQLSGEARTARVVEEVLAERSERGRITLPAFKRAIAAIRAFIRKYAARMNWVTDFTDDDIMAILAKAHKKIVKGPATMRTPAVGGTEVRRPSTEGPTEEEREAAITSPELTRLNAESNKLSSAVMDMKAALSGGYDNYYRMTEEEYEAQIANNPPLALLIERLNLLIRDREKLRLDLAYRFATKLADSAGKGFFIRRQFSEELQPVIGHDARLRIHSADGTHYASVRPWDVGSPKFMQVVRGEVRPPKQLALEAVRQAQDANGVPLPANDDRFADIANAIEEGTRATSGELLQFPAAFADEDADTDPRFMASQATPSQKAGRKAQEKLTLAAKKVANAAASAGARGYDNSAPAQELIDAFSGNIKARDAEAFVDEAATQPLSGWPVPVLNAIVPQIPSADIVRWAKTEGLELDPAYRLITEMAGYHGRLQRASTRLGEDFNSWISKNGSDVMSAAMHYARLAGLSFSSTGDRATALQTDPELVKLRGTLANAAPEKQSAAKRAVTLREKDINKGYDLWDALGQKKGGHEMYRQVHQYYEDMYNLSRALIKQRIEGMGLKPKDEAKLWQTVRLEMEQARDKGDYFPLMRHGKYYVYYKTSPVGRIFETFDTEGERSKVIARYQKDFGIKPNGQGSNVNEVRDELASESAMLRAMLDAVRKQSGGKPNIENLLDDTYQMFLQFLPERSLRKQFIHTKNGGVAGFSSDVARNFANMAGRYASQLPKLKYAHKVQAALNDADDTLKGRDPGLSERLGIFSGEVRRRAEQEFNPEEPNAALSVLNRATATFLLSGGATAMAQMIAIPQRVLPHLTRYYGFGPTNRMALKYMQFWKMVGVNFGDFGRQGFGPSIGDSAYIKNNPVLKEIFDAGQDQFGLFESNASHYLDTAPSPTTPTGGLRGLARDVTRAPVSTAIDTTKRVADVTSRALMWTFSVSERLVNQQTYMMAAELELAKSGDKEKAKEAGVRAITDAIGRYQRYERPQIMRGTLGPTLTMFKMYPVHTTSFFIRNAATVAREMSGGDPKAARAAALEMGYVLAMTGVFAGAVGMPLYSTIMMVTDLVIKSMDDEEEEAERLADDPFYGASADLRFRYRALPNLFGDNSVELGGRKIPLSDIVRDGLVPTLTDAGIGSRASLDGIWFRAGQGDSTPSVILNTIAANLPGASFVTNFGRGYDLINQGEVEKGLEAMLPAGARNLMRASRFGEEGITTNRGDPILEPDEFTDANFLAQVLGLPVQRIAGRMDAGRKVKARTVQLGKERQTLLRRFNKLGRDPQATDAQLDKLSEDIHQFNATVSGIPKLIIDQDALNNSWTSFGKRPVVDGYVLDPRLGAYEMEVLQDASPPE